MLQQLLFGLLIFFLPSNLAFHFFPQAAIVQGILVDYLIPKLYLTDIFILGILVLWVISSWTDKRHAQSWQADRLAARACRTLSGQILLISFFLITLLTGLLTSRPLASFWFWLKLVEMTLFISWLRYNLPATRHVLHATLPLAVLWQSLLVIAQWFKQGNIFGYRFLGEPVFSLATPGIARVSLGGSLKVLPYGTTPHPNVLAGFIAVSLVIIWLNSKSNPSKYIASIVGTFALFLTQSLSAWIALILAIAIGKKTTILLIPLFLLLFLNTQYFVLDTESVSRRLQLNLAAVKIWADHPLFGVGLNQFIPALSSLPPIDPTLRFFQPVHNIYLLLLAETGLVGVGLLLFALLKIVHSTSLRTILMILIIGLVDHYPLTLQTGQLLLALAIGMSLSSPKQPNSDTLPEL